MLEKGALKLVEHSGLGYYSRLFLGQKTTGKWRLAVDFLALNCYDLLHSI